MGAKKAQLLSHLLDLNDFVLVIYLSINIISQIRGRTKTDSFGSVHHSALCII